MAISKLKTGSITDDTITSAKINDGAVTNAKVSASAAIDISKTVFTGSQPTISSLSISQKDPDSSSNVTITGTNFESIPIVQFLNTSTGARITSATVTYTSSTTLVAVFPASQTVGIYKVIVENPTSLSVISSATIINSLAPNWVTSASLGSVEEGDTVNIQLLAYDDDSTAVSSYSLQSGSLPSGVTLSGDSTVGALTGTAPTVSADTAYNFTIRATDNESQTTDKAFSLTVADYNIGNSVMFDDGSSDYLSRTPSSATNRKTWTWSGWIKRGNINTSQYIFAAGENPWNNPSGQIYFISSGELQVFGYTTGTEYQVKTNRLFRDVSAWYHIVVAFDSTQSTSSDRIKIYVNGTQETSFSVSTYPSLNHDGVINNTKIHLVGSAISSSFFDGYMAECHFIDGTALTPSSFGETNSNGVWIPKKYTGSYGTNGFALEFDSSGSLGADTSGNSNNFTANNLATTSASKDTPHLNYCTINPLYSHSGITFSEGNLKTSLGGTNHRWGTGTFWVSSGKWYYECKILSDNNYNSGPGVIKYGIDDPITTEGGGAGSKAEGWIYLTTSDGHIQNNGTTYGTLVTATTNDIVMVAFDLDNGKIWIGKNGTWNDGDPSAGTGAVLSNLTGGDFTPAISGYAENFHFNFGSPGYSISSGNSDGNGYGNFEYEVPTGFYALNSKNLATYG